jgi:UDP-N-acetylmuramate dehydrogenase
MVTVEQADAIEERARAADYEPQPMPRYAVGDRVKLSAAWLIERAGFGKGTTDGAVGISTRHALAIVNRGGATAAEILDFARRVRDAVLTRFGVTLAAEPVLIGFSEQEAALLR